MYEEREMQYERGILPYIRSFDSINFNHWYELEMYQVLWYNNNNEFIIAIYPLKNIIGYIDRKKD